MHQQGVDKVRYTGLAANSNTLNLAVFDISFEKVCALCACPALILNGSAFTASSASTAPLVVGKAQAAARPGLQGGSIALLST